MATTSFSSDPPLRVGVCTLGCKVNQYETERLVEALACQGLVAVPPQAPAEAYLVNTCTVTAAADKKARKLIRQLHRQNPHAVIAVCGCYAEADRAAVVGLPGVARVWGVGDKMALAPWLAAEVRRRIEQGIPRPPKLERDLHSDWPGRSTRTRSVLVVQNGCEFVCAFCAVPKVRGPQRSRRIPEVVEEAKRRVAGGHRELVLVGVRLGAYGYDWPERRGRRWEPMARLLQALHQIEGIERIRLSSLLPIDLHFEWLQVMAELPKLCPHLHLVLQSGDDRTLRRMRRGYTTRRYAGLVERARALLPDLALTTDVIVGFPGETEEEFAASCAFIEQMEFARIHVFRYSARPGTLAATFPDSVPEAVKEARSARLFEIARASAESFHQRFVGRVVPVLTETFDRETGEVEGFSPSYLRVRLKGPAPLNQVLPVLVTAADAGGAQGVGLGSQG